MFPIRQIVEKLCIILTIILVYENAYVFYSYLFPYWWHEQRYIQFYFHLIIGHWLLINTVFHYCIAVNTTGFVSNLKLSNEIEPETDRRFTLCKKCSLYRPPRSHHCRVCKTCVVRYDHHCPWLNNCVSYNNHYHFFLFCIYMTLISAYALYFGHYHLQMKLFNQILLRLYDPIWKPFFLVETLIPYENIIHPVAGFLIFYLFLFNLVTMLLVLSLTVWQITLISKGQTCVEEKIMKENKKQNPTVSYTNTYDLGFTKNWFQFFEIENGAELLRILFIPKIFKPKHDGTSWVKNKHI
ncbi:unnamed protein product [Didymodactylos carnosus]|uniref:Palmitoyltransferase n=1 Tax=Didymodactylos carnosus TaxID=1234261 RepID=A0A813XY25_9BILA|nr:unnamed protein product [Didymodactylos carnosus]CAF1230049.1 unnamed protein product [Didymodactylos carnosus]CAF3664094.1 unnamed protein product [Didymodactylos carnosus]CAF4038137.1 unnamed protein product [Didymodactylos carnosus]